jgi:hypothetical protein
VDEILENGRRSVEALAAMYAQRYNVRLTFRRIIPGIEWCIVSKDISEKQAKQEGIERGQQAVVAGAIHKFGDSSHPENMEFNQAPGGTPLKPTEHAETHEYVYSGQLARDMLAMKEGMTAIKDVVSEEHKLLSEVVGGFVGVRQRLEQLAEKK